MQTVVQLSFCMLILKWLFSSFQILSAGYMSLSQEFLGCTITKKVKEHWARLNFTAFKNLLVVYLTNGRLVGLVARPNGRPIAD